MDKPLRILLSYSFRSNDNDNVSRSHYMRNGPWKPHRDGGRGESVQDVTTE